ncbi:hypothetical protein [Kitasatospora sp. NPDC050463]|uniref:hypothetical protein n=1 Tax=Kitasatospora sp. NPDC050463 TaxID=3155786 RepID=UPI0033F3605D
MRWLTLYARSRQVPVSAAVVTLTALVLWSLAPGSGEGPMDLSTVVLVLTANVAAAALGLGGQDAALDRTAAIRWIPRRAAHVLLIGTVAGAALLAVQAAGPELAPAAVVARDSAGMVGLAALGATVCGAQYAWALPTGWLGIILFGTVPAGRVGEVLGWMLMPPGTTVATWTALSLLVTGTVLYAVVGSRR